MLQNQSQRQAAGGMLTSTALSHSTKHRKYNQLNYKIYYFTTINEYLRYSTRKFFLSEMDWASVCSPNGISGIGM